MTSQRDKDIEWLYEHIKSYSYFDEHGRLNLELFCVELSRCFNADGILDLSPQPRDVYLLLLDMLAEKSDDEKTIELWVQRVAVNDWTPESAFVYPERTATLIHPAGLLMVFHDWIAEIGYGLMKIPFLEGDPQRYYGWAKPEWTFVYTFVDGFHESFTAFLKKIDSQGVANGKPSAFEILHKSTADPELTYDDVKQKITMRNLARQEALDRMQAAISAGFFLEAIALEEAVISNCLYLYCSAKGIHQKETSLYAMLNTVRKKLDDSHDDYSMFDDLNRWRQGRNHALHNFVTARSEDLLKSTDAFAAYSEETARNGLCLTEDICSWYEREAQDFLTTSWPTDKPLTH